MLFLNRLHAGNLLADKLEQTETITKNSVVIAIPRGGIPLAFQISQRFNLPMDIILVKKIGAPHYPELAIGSISEDDEEFYNERILSELGLGIDDVKPIKDEALKKLRETRAALSMGRVPLKLEGKNIILVDDGIATGATMEVVISVLKKRKVSSIIIATPVASADTIRQLSGSVDDIIVLHTPNPLYSVGEWYEDFTQIKTPEAIKYLAQNANINNECHDEEIIDEAVDESFPASDPPGYRSKTYQDKQSHSAP